ncbi:MAG: molybdopterin-synthase adenylyltransferase MoeB [Campylobacteraceae bacterium]|jgi:adenylyltransferase/sulfurtransferase|nr:molybdopterin-synthase adenylyltransferase MoeB [Campylobacteraceae bacterium]
MRNFDGADILPNLSPDEVTRYSRHIILPNVGIDGQKRLKKSRVLIVGGGALGSPIALYLAAAGVGTIGIVDFDEVDVSNLQRQVIHKTRNVGKKKTLSAKEAILDINPHVNVLIFDTKLTSQNALEILRDFDIVADCTDNFPARYLINDACVLLGKPLIYGSIFRFEGQSSVFWAKKGACYRCVFPSPPPAGFAPSCGEAGVFGVLPAIIGSIQANETIKLIIGGEDETLINRLLVFDAWKMRFKELRLRKDDNCPICGKTPSIKELADYEFFCGLKSEKDVEIKNISAEELRRKIDNNEKFNIIDVREEYEFKIAHIDGSKLIPLGEISSRRGEIDDKIPAVILCKSGVRSVYAIKELRKLGFKGELLNLKEGILSWAYKIDKTMAKY